jgi:hypothetical protein
MSSIVINCAGDPELAKKINDYLMSKIVPPSSDTIYISLLEDEVERIEIIVNKFRLMKEEDLPPSPRPRQLKLSEF